MCYKLADFERIGFAHTLNVNIFFSRTSGPIIPNLVCSICRVRRLEIVDFMSPSRRGGNLGVKYVKLMNFFFFLKFSTPRHGSDKLSDSNDDQRRVYQNCSFHGPRGGGSARAWPYKPYGENVLFL